MPRSDFSVLILAAGEGTRMNSSVPKVLHEISGVPLLERILRTVESLKPRSVGIVIGSGSDHVRNAIGKRDKLFWIFQKERKGSGHAVKSAAPWLKRMSGSAPHLLVVCGDTPLLEGETLKGLHQVHLGAGNSATVLSMRLEDPFGYGRIVKDDSGRVRKIVEEKDAAPFEKAIREVNSGVYFFDARELLKALPQIRNDNAKKEYYLTDVIEILGSKGAKVGSVASRNGSLESLGVNSRSDLAQAQELDQKKILERWMKEGVTVLNPAFTFVSADARIGRDTTLLPGTMIMGKTVIGEGCSIGPHAYIEDCSIGDRANIRASFVYGSKLEDDVNVGPYTHIRPGTLVKKGARVGNFSEVKKSTIGKNAKVCHLSYVGDAELGDDVNVGAGVITCNFDGEKKHRTKIGKKTFLGSNVNLVAPVTVGEGSVIGAGSTITEDVPPHSLAVARTHQVVKKDWVKNKRKRAKGR